jgi:hypothetical protein
MERKGKYFNRKVVTDVGVFDSVGEFRHYNKLLMMSKALKSSERVTDIKRQVRYKLVVNDFMVGTYIADFVVTFADGHTEVIDFKNPYLAAGKGRSTPAGQLFQYKKKLMKALFDIDVKVV